MMSIRALVGISVVFLSALLAADLRPDTIFSVLVTNDSVFASTRTGLFRASRSEKKWSAIALPAGVLPGGRLNYSSSIDASTIYYLPGANPEYPTGLPGHGLWSSADSGKTWTQVDADHHFAMVLVHTDGNLYAVVQAVPDLELETQLVSSSDGGRTWRVAQQSRGMFSINPCSANPAHICGMGALINAYWFEDAPETRNWSGARVDTDETYFERMTPAEYLAYGVPTIRLGLFPNVTQHNLFFRATLQNYFEHGFGTKVDLPGVALRAGAASYTFRQNEPKVIEASLELMPMDPLDYPSAELSLPDVKGTRQCWALRYVLPGGTQGVARASCTPTDTNKVSATSHISLNIGKPYTQSIDLESLISLETPGLYHLQLVFDDSGLNPQDWTGQLWGEPFEVTIVPSP
jgi:hypothetical protein